MSPRVWRDRLLDILEAVDEIFEFTSGMDADAFSADAKTQKAALDQSPGNGQGGVHPPRRERSSAREADSMATYAACADHLKAQKTRV